MLKAKATTNNLRILLNEGGDERNKLLPVLADFDAKQSKAILADWSHRVAAVAERGNATEDTLTGFKMLDTIEPALCGDRGRSPQQEQLENDWNKKLQILGTMIREISDGD